MAQRLFRARRRSARRPSRSGCRPATSSPSDSTRCGRALPGVQRGLLGLRRRRPVRRGSTRKRSGWPGCGRAHAGRAGGARTAGADGAAGRPAGPGSTPPATWSRWRSRTAPAGIGAQIAEGRRPPRRGRRRGRPGSVPAAGGDRRLPCRGADAPTPTGRRSPSSTGDWRRARARSSSSTGLWRWRWPTDRRPGCRRRRPRRGRGLARLPPAPGGTGRPAAPPGRLGRGRRRLPRGARRSSQRRRAALPPRRLAEVLAMDHGR